jgi:putative inorganic carbon (hco3(-)) transporter
LIRFQSDSGPLLLRAARWCAFGSAASALFSIAVSEGLLALALATLLMSGGRLRLPRIWLPIALWMLVTVVSLALSDQPAAGIPAVRKFYVFLELLVVFSTFDLVWTRRLFWAWAGIGAASALWGCGQFVHRMAQARTLGRPFYAYYLANERITGFISHWNTFSAQMMFVVLFAVAFILFADDVRGPALWTAAACGVAAAVGMVLGFTRIIIFLACPVAVLYLVWWWRRWLVAVLPLVALAAVLVSPAPLKERADSIFHPRKDIDSNDFRRVAFRTGLEMIKAHPWFGVGPERANQQTGLFDQYVPKDVPRPLPAGWYGHLHSLYIHYAAERGIPAMLVLVWMLAQMLWDFWRGTRKLPPRSDAKFVLHAAAAVVIGVILEGFFEVNLGISGVLTMFLPAVACGYVALEKADARADA